MALKKSLTIKLPVEVKKEIEMLAKKRGVRPSELMLEWINAGLIQNKPTRDICNRVVDVIQNNGVFKQEGILEVEMKPHKSAVLYIPDAWCVSEDIINSTLKVPKSVLHLVAADLAGYNVIDPESRNKYTSSLVKHFIKTMNIYTLGGAANLNTAVQKVFRQDVPRPIILSKKIDPIRLAKVCAENSGKKVIYVLDLKEFGENASDHTKSV